MAKNPYKNLSFLYDVDDQLSNQLKVNGVPYEFIIDKKGNGRIRTIGYANDIEAVYLAETIRTIDNLLKE